jgi:hypothetical protein
MGYVWRQNLRPHLYIYVVDGEYIGLTSPPHLMREIYHHEMTLMVRSIAREALCAARAESTKGRR